MSNVKVVIKGVTFGVVASLIWGAWPAVSVLGRNEQLDGADLTVLRFAIAGCLMLPVLVIRFSQFLQYWKKGIVLSIGSGLPYMMLAMEGLKYAPSGHFGIIAPSSMLIFTAFGSIFGLREKLSSARVLGVLFILIGIVIIGSYSAVQSSSSFLLGDLMFVGCGGLWASYTLLCRYWNMNSWLATAQVSVISMLVYLPVYLFNEPHALFDIPLTTLLLHGAFQGGLVAVLALFCYSKAVALLGTVRGAIFSAMVPPLSLIFGYFLLDERIAGYEYVGLVIVFWGMLLALGLCFKSANMNRLRSLAVPAFVFPILTSLAQVCRKTYRRIQRINRQ